MAEHALWEGLTGGLLTEVAVETEGLGNGQVALYIDEWLSLTLLLSDNFTALLGHYLVDFAHAAIGGEDFDEVVWFK